MAAGACQEDEEIFRCGDGFTFEPDVFAANDGPPCHFVGHPIMDRVRAREPLPTLGKKHGIRDTHKPQ